MSAKFDFVECQLIQSKKVIFFYSFTNLKGFLIGILFETLI